MSLREAEGFSDLGLWQEAWDAIEDVPPDERMNAEVWRLKLKCCGVLGAWEIGSTLAELLRHGELEDRDLAAMFHFTQALHEIDVGRLLEAREAVKRATEICPEERLAMLNDSRIECLF